eukprot:9603291-Alexandrium_andersonii.AAC.1
MPRQRARKDCVPNKEAFEKLLDDPRQGLWGDVERWGSVERRGLHESLRCCTPRAAPWLTAAAGFRP